MSRDTRAITLLVGADLETLNLINHLVIVANYNWHSPFPGGIIQGQLEGRGGLLGSLEYMVNGVNDK